MGLFDIRIVAGSLALLCACVSLVYGFTAYEELPKALKEAAWTFFLMFGGLCMLGVLVKVIPMVFGGA